MLDNVIGQKKIKDFISRSIKNGKIGQCYVFVGEEGMGKKTLANAFAKALVREEKTACGKCASCALADAGTHPDIITVRPEEDKKSIGVSEVREVVSQAAVKPYRADKKVVILSNDITEAGQNALLKIIEEPPAYMVFIFTQSSESSLIETVRSRSCVMNLVPYDRSQTDEIARQNGILDGVSDYAFFYAQGNAGKAVKLESDSEFGRLRKQLAETLFQVPGGNAKTAVYLMELFEKNKDRAEDMFNITESILRDIFIIKSDAQSLVWNLDMAADIKSAAEKTTVKAALLAAENVLKYRRMLKSNVNYTVLSASFANELWEVL